MTMPADVAVYFINSDNEVFKKVQYVDPPTTIYYVHLSVVGIATSVTTNDAGYPPADIASTITMYADGSLADYKYNNMDTGDYVHLQFAEVPADQRQVFGQDNQYSNGPVTYSETLKDGVKEITSFTNGNPTFKSIEKLNAPEPLKLVGTLTSTGFATITLTNPDHPTGLSVSGQGSLVNMINLNASHLITDNGAGLIGNDGSTVTLVGTDGASLVGPDGGTFNSTRVSSLITDNGAGLIGNDGSTLVPAYNSLIGNDGSTLIARDGAGIGLNLAASIRGYRAYTGPSNFTETADDFGDDAAHAGALEVGGAVTGALETEGDRDFFSVQLEAGRSYTFSLSGVDSGNGLLSNPFLSLHDANGVVDVDDDSGIGRDARLTFTPTTAGTYTLQVMASADDQRGTYELSVEADPKAAFVKASPAITASDGIVGGGVVMAAITAGQYAGGFVLAWCEKDNDQHPVATSGDFFVQIQIVTANGTIIDLDSRPQWTTYSPGSNDRAYDADDSLPSISVFDDGSFVVTWNDEGYNSPKHRTHYVTVNADGTPNTDSTMIPNSSSGQVVYGSSGADVVVLNNGDWLTVLHRLGVDGPVGNAPDYTNVQVSLNGGTPFTIAEHTDFQNRSATVQHFGTAAVKFGNGAIAVWTDATGDIGNAGEVGSYPESTFSIRGAVLSASGTVLASFDVNDGTDYAQYIANGSQVADLGDGRFVVAWTSGEYLPPGNSSAAVDSYFRIFSYDSGTVTPVTGDIAIEGEQDGVYVDNATVVALPSGGFAIVYSRNGTTVMQTYDESGVKVGNVTTVASGGDGGTAAVALDDGRVAVSFIQGGVAKIQYMQPNTAPTNILLSDAHIDENSLQGTIVGTLSTTDANTSDTFTYSIVSPDGYFYLDGTNLRFDDNVDHVTQHLDYEQEQTHNVTIQTKDSAGVTFNKTFTIHIDDVNEWPITLEETGAQVTENSAIGTFVATLSATDEDGHGPFTYSLVDGNGQAITGMPFGVVGDEIRVTAPLDAEVQNNYQFYVRISDGQFTTDTDVNSLHPDVYFSIYVEGVDDTAPTDITLTPAEYDGVDEGLPAGADVGTLSVSDADTYDPTAFTFQILNSNGTFRLQADQYGYMHLVTNKVLDYEPAHSHQVTVRVTDPSGGHYDETLTVDVEDIDEAPVITGGGTTKEITVPAGTSYNTVLYKIVATDPDGDDLEYGVHTSGYFDFNVDDAGNLRFNNNANSPGVYNFKVYAGDDGGHYVYQDVKVTVTSANAAPVITGNPNIGVTINENSTVVRTIEANDAEFDTITWSLGGGPDMDKFKLVTISQNYARLEFKTAPDYESATDVGHNNHYNVIVLATDSKGNYDTQSIEVEVLDLNDTTPQPSAHAPKITSNGGGDKATITLKENVVTATTVHATDADAGTTLTYSIAAGADSAKFAIDASTGALTFITPPDFEAKGDANKDNKYLVTVQASDGVRTDTQALTVKITNDTNKTPPAGTTKADKLNGTDSEETLDGKQGNDTIKAKAGGDIIIGGKGADKLYGGVDGVADIFKFIKGDSGTTAKTWDKVYDFVSGIDKIDLSGIDGDPARGQQDLRFVTAFKAPGKKTDGQFRVVDAGNHVNVEIDYNGDKKADMIIQVMNVDHLLVTDFIV